MKVNINKISIIIRKKNITDFCKDKFNKNFIKLYLIILKKKSN